jgi:hypothetical protein
MLQKIKRAVVEANLTCGVCQACTSPCRKCQHCRCGECKHCRQTHSRGGHRLSRNSSQRVCLHARLGEQPCTRVECHKWKLHRFRHTFATTALRGGADIGAVKDLLGHSTIATTEIYTAAAKEAEAQEAICKAFARKRRPLLVRRSA